MRRTNLKHAAPQLSIALLVSGALLSHAARANLIQDGGFESPIVGPGGYESGNDAYTVGQSFGPNNAWTVVGSDAGNVAVYPNTETIGSPATVLNVEEGVQALDLTGRLDNGAAIGVAQTFATTPGTMYSLSFYEGQLLYGGNTTHPSITVDLNGSLFQTATESAAFSGLTTVWQQFSYDFTATGSTTTLSFINSAPSGVIENGLDNVVVNTVPLPAAAWLMFSGIAGLGVVGRRRRVS